MKNNKSIFHPIKLVGALVFLMAFVLNIQTSLNGDWELVNVGFAQGSSGGGSGAEVSCWSCIKEKNGSQVRYCGTCNWVNNSTDCIFTVESKCTQ